MFRIGNGYDVHRLAENRKLIIGGVDIPYEKGLLGHSDADVLTHAIADAILGAAALGDIGLHYPDNNAQLKGMDSLVMLGEIVEMVSGKGFIICNLDATIIAQAPKMRPHIDKMRENIARVCKIGVDCVNVKATTEEGLGFTGSGEGIASSCVCLLETI
ncbi:MAG: 2-C-methyl-D-erythritol 2,4-cyclodiphosphate synthase [Clostridia bacterium]|nr:2-C-methyl-D-erythritol 2,4-cyclodiphosphate synthase [Clostridia bacterium]